jgi:hypothetical protein
MAGRGRIGKTSFIQQALKHAGRSLTLYIEILDSDPLGACNADAGLGTPDISLLLPTIFNASVDPTQHSNDQFLKLDNYG